MNIFATGVFLESTKLINDAGVEYWGWVATGFEDDSFHDGEVFNPPTTADTQEELEKDENEDDE